MILRMNSIKVGAYYFILYNNRINQLFLFLSGSNSLSKTSSVAAAMILFSWISDLFFSVWGSVELRVSGTFQIVNRPDIINGIPRMVDGNGFQYLANCPRNGATAQNILATVEEVPTAWALRFVG